jgi:hypothetical protein
MKNQEIMQTIEFLTGFVRACRYHEQKQILDVTGNDGTVYQYFDVPETVLNEFIHSDSPGEYYKKNIKTTFRRLFKAYDYSVMY